VESMGKLKSKNVLITGGAGFIGANFARKFLELGYKITIIEKKGVDFWRIHEIKNKIKIYFVELTDAKKTENLIEKIKPSIVLHFAMYGGHQRVQKDIDRIVDTNIKGTINLVNACHKTGVGCFINTSTSIEYGIKDKPMREDDMLEANDLYSITKSAGTLYCQMMARRFGFPAVIMRLSPVYGFFDEKERLIATIIKSCLTNSKLTLSQPDSVRDFIFIEDVISAYLSAIKNVKKAKGQIFNIGSGKQYAIAQVVKIIKNITHSKIKPEYGKIQSALLEPKVFILNNSKARNMLRWQQAYNLEDGLRKNIDWFKNNLYYYK